MKSWELRVKLQYLAPNYYLMDFFLYHYDDGAVEKLLH